MSMAEDDSKSSGDLGKERQVMLMNPASSVVEPARKFFPFGCTPPENLLGYIPKDARRADILLLGCSDARHALFTLWSHASECNRDRGRWEEEGIVGRSGNPSEALQTLRFTLNDREPACLARVLLLLQLFLQARDRLVDACSPSASTHDLAAYFDVIARCFSAYYNVYVDKGTQAAVQNAAAVLLKISASPAAWARSRIGAITHIAEGDTLDRLRAMWFMYADTNIVNLKPKRTLDKERSDFHRRNVPKKDLSPKILNGDGPGVAAALSVDWGAEMTGLHREYQTWGYFDPFRELPKSFNSSQMFYNKTNPAMIATDQRELDFQLHYSCNPFAAFHLDTAWIDFKDASEPCPGNEKINKPFFGGPPVLPGSDSSITSRNMIQGSPTEIMYCLRSKLMLLVLEQLSRMCWAVNWAVLEAKNANVPSQSWPIVDVRLNIVVGDALDTCDVICCLSSEGLEASGVSRDGEESTRVCALMPSMSLRPFHLDRRDLGGPGRFDFIDSADLSTTLGVLNVVTAASPLLKPYPHAILRTDLRRSGASRKRHFSCRDKIDVLNESEAYIRVTEDDWFTSMVHECAMLLGVVPVGGIVPMVGHFNSMLEVGQLLKCLGEVSDAGDLGQRMRLIWKQACLVDQHAGTYVGSRTRIPLTLHPRPHISPENFSSMVMPFWVYMTRSLYAESSKHAKVGEGDEQQLRVSPYTTASFARLLCHSLRFLKLDMSHFQEVVEKLPDDHKGLFRANVVAQLEMQLYNLGLVDRDSMSTSDVVRWARDCPWWNKMPATDTTAIVPVGSPGMCRVVMIASPQAVEVVRQLRNPALCVVLEVESQKVRMLISALHFCFVRVHRESGSLPPGEVEGEPWYVIKDRILHVRETRTDDPEAELMVSFLMSSIELVSATRGSDVELELRLQDSASRHVAQESVAKLLDKAEGVIFRTNLSKLRETAVIFPSKKAGTTIFERWAPQSAKWETLLQNDKGLMEPGLRPCRVGKMDRYVVTPSRPEMVLIKRINEWREFKTGWLNPYDGYDAKRVWTKPEEAPSLLFTLQMSNPAARALLGDKQTKVEVKAVPPCSIQFVIDAPEKNVKGKRKKRAALDDFSKGGIDGGLKYRMMVPLPVVLASFTVNDNNGIEVKVQLQQFFQQKDFSHPFMNVVQTVDTDGRKMIPPLISNWAFPVRSTSNSRSVQKNVRSRELVKSFYALTDESTVGVPIDNYSELVHRITMEYLTPEKPEEGFLTAGVWYALVFEKMFKERQEMPSDERKNVLKKGQVFMMLNVLDLLVDESNESLVLDVVLVPEGQAVAGLYEVITRDRDKPLKVYNIEITNDLATAWRNLVPMAVERGRRTYSHLRGCRLLSHDEDSSEECLCLCGADKEIPRNVFFSLKVANPNLEQILGLYRAVLPVSMATVPCLRPDIGENLRNVTNRFSLPLSSFNGHLDYTGPSSSDGDMAQNGSSTLAGERSAGEGDGDKRTDTANSNGHHANYESDRETAEILVKAGLKKMPKTAIEWEKFERVKKGLPLGEMCAFCGKPNATKRCTRCKNVRYCSKTCQHDHWLIHKKSCS